MTEMQNQSGNTDNQSWKVAAGILGLLFVGALIFGIMFFNKYQATVDKAADFATDYTADQNRLLDPPAQFDANKFLHARCDNRHDDGR